MASAVRVLVFFAALQDPIVLALCSLQESVPPVMAFHLGSLGFLSPFEFFDYREKVDDVLQGRLFTLYNLCLCTLWQKIGFETGFKTSKRWHVFDSLSVALLG